MGVGVSLADIGPALAEAVSSDPDIDAAFGYVPDGAPMNVVVVSGPENVDYHTTFGNKLDSTWTVGAYTSGLDPQTGYETCCRWLSPTDGLPPLIEADKTLGGAATNALVVSGRMLNPEGTDGVRTFGVQLTVQVRSDP